VLEGEGARKLLKRKEEFEVLEEEEKREWSFLIEIGSGRKMREGKGVE